MKKILLNLYLLILLVCHALVLAELCPLLFWNFTERTSIDDSWLGLEKEISIGLNIHDTYKYTIVIISFNRTKCLNRTFNRIYYEEKLPKETEILIADDNTPSASHKSYLARLSKLPKVTVFINYGTHGAFYNKLNGFLMARGKYIMTCDDDDIADVGFYSEMINHINDKYDIIYSLNSVYTKRKFSSINEMIISFHNFCNIAFKKDLILSIEYPKSVQIRRDDAPLVIPMYMNTDFSKVLSYSNNYKYRVDKYCDNFYTHKHQSYFFREQEYVRNGLDFLIKYAENSNKSYLLSSIKQSYKGYLK